MLHSRAGRARPTRWAADALGGIPPSRGRSVRIAHGRSCAPQAEVIVRALQLQRHSRVETLRDTPPEAVLVHKLHLKHSCDIGVHIHERRRLRDEAIVARDACNVASQLADPLTLDGFLRVEKPIIGSLHTVTSHLSHLPDGSFGLAQPPKAERSLQTLSLAALVVAPGAPVCLLVGLSVGVRVFLLTSAASTAARVTAAYLGARHASQLVERALALVSDHVWLAGAATTALALAGAAPLLRLWRRTL